MNKLPEDKVIDYLQKAKKTLDIFYKDNGIYSPIFADDEEIIEIAKMIQLEEHREDK